MARKLVVSDAGGNPIGGAVVTVARASSPVPELAYVTGDDGAVHIGLPSGPVILSVALRSGEVRLVETTVGEEDEGLLPVTIRAETVAPGPDGPR